jgi:murein DD-endopeptidase MepM/ murein hydrolase activator NlpD
VNRSFKVFSRALLIILALGLAVGQYRARSSGTPSAPRSTSAKIEAPVNDLGSAVNAARSSPASAAVDMAESVLTLPEETGSVPDAVLAMPVVGVKKENLRDTWGESRRTHLHTAIDILAPRGTPVLAAVDGTILKLFTSAAGGLTVYLADRSRSTLYYYAHLDHYADGLHDGLEVTQGALIGYVGTTGNAPVDTPHLHFGIEHLPPTGEWWKGVPTNPYPILMERAVTVPPHPLQSW